MYCALYLHWKCNHKSIFCVSLVTVPCVFLLFTYINCCRSNCQPACFLYIFVLGKVVNEALISCCCCTFATFLLCQVTHSLRMWNECVLVSFELWNVKMMTTFILVIVLLQHFLFNGILVWLHSRLLSSNVGIISNKSWCPLKENSWLRLSHRNISLFKQWSPLSHVLALGNVGGSVHTLTLSVCLFVECFQRTQQV